MKYFYQLICTYERNINCVGFYDTFEETHDAMLDDFSSVVDYSVDALYEYFEDKGGDADINEWSAWVTHHGDNCDWQILCLKYSEGKLSYIMPL